MQYCGLSFDINGAREPSRNAPKKQHSHLSMVDHFVSATRDLVAVFSVLLSYLWS